MKKNNKGFTLAELLIVVAIIAVLVAVAIPVFTAQLHKAQDATEIANARSLYAERQADYLSAMNGGTYTPNTAKDKLANGTALTWKNGTCTVDFNEGDGYKVSYKCNDTTCENATEKVFGGSNS